VLGLHGQGTPILAIVVPTAPGPLAMLIPGGSSTSAILGIKGIWSLAAGIVVVQLQAGTLGTLIAASAEDLVAGYIIVGVLQFRNAIGRIFRGQGGILRLLLLLLLLVLLMLLVGLKMLLLQLVARLHIGLLLHLDQLDHIVLQLHDIGQCGLVAYVQQHFGRHRASAHHMVKFLVLPNHFLC